MRPHTPEATYPEDVEANGKERIPVAVLVPGLLDQGHQHAAGHRECPALLRPPDRQQELRVLPKCVWARTEQGKTGSPSMLLPKPFRGAQTQGICPRIPTRRSTWTKSGSLHPQPYPPPISPQPPQDILQTHDHELFAPCSQPLCTAQCQAQTSCPVNVCCPSK